MKKRIVVLAALFILFVKGGPLEDSFAQFEGRYDAGSESKSIETASEAVEKMEGMIEVIEKNDSLLMEYVLAKDWCLMKCGGADAEKNRYTELLKRVGTIYKERKSPFLDYSLAILYGRLAETSNIIDAVKANVPNKIKKHTEKVIAERPEIDGYGAYLILGRLHAVTPKVIYFTGWKSLNESERCLKIYIEKNPQTIIGRLYLAETYGMMKEEDRRDSLIEEIISSNPESKRFYEDRAIIDSLSSLNQ